MQPRSTPITIIFKAAALSCSTLFPPASLFPSFSVSFLFSFFSVLFLLHFEEKKAKSESVYRVSLDPVQNLCLLDENPAVSQKERGIRNWTILSAWDFPLCSTEWIILFWLQIKFTFLWTITLFCSIKTQKKNFTNI